MPKKQIGFNPNVIGLANNDIFGLPFNEKTANTIIVHVPRDVTVSSGAGTASNCDAIFYASLQVDLYDDFYPDTWKKGIAMKQLPLLKKNNELRKQAERYIDFLADGGDYVKNSSMKKIRETINSEGKKVNELLKETVKDLIKKKKSVALLGGDHSTSLGMIQTLAEIHKDGFGILHIDAHADLRDAYEGFTYSHASVMFNASRIKQVKKLVQVGIRDYCEDEMTYVKKNPNITMFDWRSCSEKMFAGTTRSKLCADMISKLPEKVYISVDIDGLAPSLCPKTGTPVPGGLSYEQAVYLFEQVVRSGKKIIAFDLVEVGNDSWDANIGARLLYKLCACMHKSQKK